MPVYKAFLGGIRESRWVVLIYSLIFISISLATLSQIGNSAQESFSMSKPRVLVRDEAPDSRFSRTLVSYLESVATVQITELSHDEAVLMVATGASDLLVTIPADAEERVALDDTVLDIYYELPSSAGNLAAVNISSFLRYVDATYTEYGAIDYDAILGIISKQVTVEMLPADVHAQSKTSWFRSYMVYQHYIFLACALFVLSPILVELNEGHLKARVQVSALRPLSFLAQITLGMITYLAGFTSFFMLLGLSLIGFEIDLGVLGIIILDIIVFSLAIAALVILISSLRLGKTALSSVANALSLILAFTSGTFIPVKFLPEGIVSFAKFFPLYHSAQIAGGSASDAASIAYHLGIQLLFATVCTLIALYFSRSRRQTAIKADPAK